MRRTICGGALLTISLGLAGGLLPMPDAPAKPSRPAVRVALADSLLPSTSATMTQLALRTLRPLLRAQTRLNGELVLGGDALTLGQKLRNGEAQVGAFYGFELAWARQQCPTLKPIVITVNRHRYDQVKVMIRKDSTAARCDDLVGKSVALPADSRHHCRLFFERRFIRPDESAGDFFSQVTAPNDTEDALDDVVEGKVEAAIVDAADLVRYQEAKPGRARRLKALCESERFPCAAIAYQPGQIDEATVARFRTGLIGARNNARGRQMLQLLRITRFEPVPNNYESRLVAIAKAYPPPEAE
jgi:ABC-type phosphate/phosphonate transport system substrate-binding protein